MSPFGWIKFGLAAGKALIDLWRMGRDAAEDSEPTNPVKVREQAAGASRDNEADNAGKRRR